VDANSSQFDYVEFRYSDGGLILGGKNQSVKHSIFTFNTLALDAGNVADAPSTVITNDVFYANEHALQINGGTPIDATCVFHNSAKPTEVNTFQAIEVTTDVSDTVTWSNTEVAYALTAGTFYVSSPAALTLASGVALKFGAGDGMSVESGATLTGAATATFTAYTDDSVKGNADGAAVTPTAAYWAGVYDAGTDTWLSGTNVLYAEQP
jgi:hypothetical protein